MATIKATRVVPRSMSTVCPRCGIDKRPGARPGGYCRDCADLLKMSVKR